MLFNHRKWNILAFRGRLMSLLVLTHSGVSPRPHLPQESRIFDLLGWAFILNGFSPSHFHKCFNYHNTNHRIDYRSLSRSTVTLIGTEGGDSWVWDCALLVPSKTIAITHPTEVICRNAFMTNILLARGSSHARGKRPPAVEINSPAHIQKSILIHLSYSIYFQG